jgi:hypothetical protein
MQAVKLSTNLYDIYHCYVCSEKTPDDGQRNCPKHVDFYSKNTSEKLVHLVGFIIRTEFGYLCGWREDVVSIIGTSKFNNPGLFRDDSHLLVIATVCIHVVP